MAKKRYTDVVEMMNDLTGDRDFADELAGHLAQRVLITELVARRAVCGLTQGEIAAKIGWSQGRISKLESSTDSDLNLGDLLSYADATGTRVEITLVGKGTTAVDRVKHHAFCIKRLTDHLAHLAMADGAIAAGVARFFNEATFNLLHMLYDSAKKLPGLTEEPSPKLTVQTLDVDDGAEGEPAENTPPKRRRKAPCG